MSSIKMNFFRNLFQMKRFFFKKENFYLLVFILVLFLIDRYSKSIVIENFSNKSYFLNDFVNLALTWNTGIGFGFLSSTSDFEYNLVSTLIGLVIMILIYVLINSKLNEKIILSLIIGGALGNYYDRLVFNAVPDFIDLHFKNFHWFTFNIADVFITLGVISYIISGNQKSIK